MAEKQPLEDAPYDYLVVGAGLFGCTMARQLTDAGKKCLVIEKRPYISGNCWSEMVDGIEVHRHGPHVFHSDNPRVLEYVNRFSNFRPYQYRMRVSYKGRIFSFPINLMTMHQLWGLKTPKEAEAALKSTLIPRSHGKSDLESWALENMGHELYEIFVKGYTSKRWGRPPSELPETIVHGMPIRTIFDDRPFGEKSVSLPDEGYVSVAARMLEGIDVRLNCDFFDGFSHWKSRAKTVIYSGSPDRLFDYDQGKLEYRSLEFEEERYEGSFQGCPVMNYTDPDIPWTRIAEYKYFMEKPPPDRTVVVREYPKKFDGSNEPYYPVDSARNRKIADEYINRAEKNGIIVGGRLGSYRYYSIHQVIGQALSLSEKLIRG